MARPMPVLPLVGSMMMLFFLRMPFFSASSIMARPMRSLMLPPGLARSSFMWTVTRDGNSRLMRTCGVLPMVSRMLFAFMSGLVGGCAGGVLRNASDVELDGVHDAVGSTGANLAAAGDDRTRRDALREPRVAGDDAAVSHHRLPSEDGGVGVHHDVVLNRGVALLVGQGLLHHEGAQRDALIDGHVVADDGRLADDDARPMVDDEAAADGGARVDVHAGALVGVLGEQARQQREAEPVQRVGH